MILSIAILSVAMPSILYAQTSVDNKVSVRAFVQKFYDWYGKLDAANVPGSKAPSPYSLTLKHKPPYIQGTLLNALIADEEAQAKVPGDIVGLDYDPITSAQDTRSGYQVGNIIQNGDKFFVDVHDIEFGHTQKAVLSAPLVLTAEVVKINSQWMFLNFFYPKSDGGGDLINRLKSLADDRAKWAIENTKKGKGKQ